MVGRILSLYEDLKDSLEGILSYERGTSDLEFIEDTVIVENSASEDFDFGDYE